MELSGAGPIRHDGILEGHVATTRAKRERNLNFAKSVFVYRSLFNGLASPQRLGLSEEDLITAWPADEAVTVTYRMPGGQAVDLPLLVPANRLYWYNDDFFSQHYGESRAVYYYTHVPLMSGEALSQHADLLDLIATELERGAVIITDCYARDPTITELEDWNNVLAETGRLHTEVTALRGNEADGVLSQYVASVGFEGVDGFAPGVPFYEQYLQACEAGLLTGTVGEGVEVVRTLEGSDAERLWAIYEGPFDALSGGHALRAGFDRKGFMAAMRDPAVVKVVRRADSGITTLCLFVMDLKHCPWLNAEFFEEQYWDAFHTRNILVFTAVVSDEEVRGSAYAPGLIRVLTELAGMRGTEALVTFECNGISSRYLPRIVRRAITQARGASVSGLDQPVSRLMFKAISAIP